MNWYLSHEGQTFGPFDEEQAKQEAKKYSKMSERERKWSKLHNLMRRKSNKPPKSWQSTQKIFVCA